ncbi:MAG: PAS domain S-box protein [Ferruginibacter sp.]
MSTPLKHNIKDVTNNSMTKNLNASESKLHDFIMQAPAVLALLKGPEHRFEIINSLYKQLLGNREVIGKTVGEAFPELVEQGFIELLDNVYNTGETFIGKEMPSIFDKGNGPEQLFLNFTYQAFKNDKAETEGILVFAYDVTEQVTARNKIEESENRFSILADSIPNLAWMAYTDGNIFWYNKKWFEYTGTTLAEMHGWGWQSVHHPEELPNVLTQWKASIESGQPFEMVFPIKAADGKFRQFLTRVLPVYDSENKIYRWFGTNTDISNQIEAEEKIKESEAKFRTLSETIPHMIWTATPDGKKNFFNKYFLDYTGLSFEELKDEGWQATILPEDLKKEIQQWHQALKTGEDFRSEKRIRHQDGTYRWHLSQGIAQKDKEGNIIGWMGTNTEIEEQKKYREQLEIKVKERTYQLHIQNETFKQAEESSMQGSYSFNLTSGKLFYSENLFGLIGYMPNEFEPSLEEFNKHVHPEDREYVRQAAQKVLDSKRADEWHYRMITKTGTLINIKGTGRVIESGSEKLLVGTLQDITKDVLVAEALIEKEDYLNQIISNAPDAVIVINEKSIITLWNPKTEKIFGWKSEEVLGLHLTDTIIPIQYREAHREGMKRFLKTGEVRILNKTLELTALNKEGKEFPISLTISQATQQGNKLFIAFLRDITLEKQNKEALIFKTQQLEEMNQVLELKNKELASFTYIASHDLQEPLRKIQIFSRHIVEAEKFSAKTQDYFNRIIASGERMQNLIVSLIDFSRTSATELIFEPCNLNAIVEESKDDLHISIIEKQAVLEYENLPKINGVHLQLSQLFTNLISNALKYSRPEIAPHVKITAERIAGSKIKHVAANIQKEYHAIKIADNGIGFEKEYEGKIFELFQRLHGRNEYSGTGIGLSIVKKIVTNHNGFIVSEGRPGIGATFTIYLPVK